MLAKALQNAFELRRCGLDIHSIDLQSGTLWYSRSETNDSLRELLPQRLKSSLRVSRTQDLGYPVPLHKTVNTFAELLAHAHEYFTPFVSVAVTLPETDEFPTIYVLESATRPSAAVWAN